MKFEALIDGVHYDPKKGAVKIVLIGASQVSLDELTTLSPKDESIQVTFESEQTKLDVSPDGSAEERESEEGRIVTEFPTKEAEDSGAPITLNEEAAANLKKAADRLRKGGADEDEIEESGVKLKDVAERLRVSAEEERNAVNLKREIREV